jgi:hypothetical protein
METAEKLRTILKNLEGKKLLPEAFHTYELVETKSDDENWYFEYQIGTDILEMHLNESDMSLCLTIYLNGEFRYETGYFGETHWDEDDNEIEIDWDEYLNHDEDAEALFEIIMQHGGVLDEEGSKTYALSCEIYSILYGKEK